MVNMGVKECLIFLAIIALILTVTGILSFQG